LNERAWKDDVDPKGGRLRTTLNRVNLQLRKAGVPWLYRLKNGYVVRVDRNLQSVSPR